MVTTRITHGPSGRLIRGHVLDCSRGPLEEALRRYDPQLYISWNTRKLRGWGCWEVRQKPLEKNIIDSLMFKGSTIHVLAYKELDIINHVIDVPFLNYGILDKIKRMDSWAHSYKGKDFVNHMDYSEAKFEEKIENKMVDDLEYNLKQMKPELRYFRDFVLSGQNPADLAKYWNKS